MRRRPARVLLTIAVLPLTLAACSAASQRDAAGGDGGPDALAGSALYVDPLNPAVQQARELRAEGDVHDAELLERIADRPVATWFADGAESVRARARALTSAAAARGALAVIVAYDIPDRDCAGRYSAGGASTPAAYRAWIAQLAAGIGARRAVVVLEPDALADLLSGCLSASAARTRLALLRYAIATLRRDSAALVYLDAGNPSWIEPPRRLVGPMRAAGIARANGFALNVANFQTTAANVVYGDKLSHLLGGAHFVIDTSRNGNGPDTNPADAPDWCNPPGRALGHEPSTSTGRPRLDAYLWVKQPGESDGTCRPGAPPAGGFWTRYALALAAASP